VGAKKLAQLAEDFQVGDDIDMALALAKRGERVLDLGCGYGRVLIPLSEDGVDMYGLDLSPVMITAADRELERRKLNASCTVGDMTSLPYKSESFDKVFSFWSSFSHLMTEADQLACLSEVFRVLKKPGTAVIVLPDPQSSFWQDKVQAASNNI